MKLEIDTRAKDKLRKEQKQQKVDKTDKENDNPIIDTLEAERDYKNVQWDQVLSNSNNDLRLDQYMSNVTRAPLKQYMNLGL